MEGVSLLSQITAMLDVRKNFSRRVVGHWSRLPREVIESLSSEMFKKHGGVVFRDVV